MSKVRQDAWSHEDDLLLAETVLRHIREGSTQLEAFEEVGDRLNRTGAACGFRWNAIVRRKYESAIDIAKKQRKQRKRQDQQLSRHWQQRTSYMESDRVLPSDLSIPEETYSLDEPDQEPIRDTNKSIQSELTLSRVISYLQNLQVSNQSTTRMEKENSTLKAQNDELLKKVDSLEKIIGKLKKEHQTIEDDYQSLIGIMERARRLVMLQDQDEQGSSFKMDKNGNLEKLAK